MIISCPICNEVTVTLLAKQLRDIKDYLDPEHWPARCYTLDCPKCHQYQFVLTATKSEVDAA